MRMRRIRTSATAVAVLLALSVTPARADEYDAPPDATVQGGVRAATWEPYIPTFYVAPIDAGAKDADTPVAPGLAEGWAALKQDARVRRGEIDVTDMVVSGWRVDTTTERKGLGFQVHVTENMRDPLATLPLDGEAILRCDLDVLVPVSDAEKKALVTDKKLFQVVERKITLHLVSPDPTAYRAKAEEEPLENSSRIHETRPYPLVLPSLSNPIARSGWSLRTKGVYEIRVKARVAGRLNEKESEEIKDVEAAIRVAVTDSAVSISRLSFKKQYGVRYYRRK